MRANGAGGRFVPWPGPAWGCGLGAAAAWALVSAWACCLPPSVAEEGGEKAPSHRPSYGGPGDGMGVPGPVSAFGAPGLGGSMALATAGHAPRRTHSGGGLGTARASSGGPSGCAAPFTADLPPEDAAALGAVPAAPPSAPPSAPHPLRVPAFHGPSAPGGDLPPRGGGVAGFVRRVSGGRAGKAPQHYPPVPAVSDLERGGGV